VVSNVRINNHFSKSFEIKSLTSLRAIACLTVLLGHAGNYGFFYNLRGAEFVGVMLFFTLSGFLMVYHYSDCYIPEKCKSFLIRRLARIYPLYVCAVIVFAAVTYNGITLGIRKTWIYHFSIFHHMFLIDSNWVFWSIRVEIIFYLLFPILAGVIAYLYSRISASFALFLLAVFWLTVCLIPDPLTSHSYLAVAFLRGMKFLLGGCLIGYVYKIYGPYFRHYSSYTAIAFLFMLGMYICSIPSVHSYIFSSKGHYYARGVYHYSIFLSLLMAAIIFVCAAGDKHMRWTMHNPFLIFLGEISYGMYLFHDLFLRAFATIPLIKLDKRLGLIIGLLFTIFTSYILHRVIEKPCIMLGKKYSRYA
jgi:peptidoglycan/LPS O-acetylase OafA/YrhL